MSREIAPFTVSEELVRLAARGAEAVFAEPLEAVLDRHERLGMPVPWRLLHLLAFVGLAVEGCHEEANAFARAAGVGAGPAPGAATHPPDLRTFAEAALRAEQYPECRHHFRAWRCECGAEPVTLFVCHQRGSVPRDFRGEIHATCTSCAREWLAFGQVWRDPNQPAASWPRSFPAEQLAREDRPTCGCGHSAFFVATCERMEGWHFDEGVVVASCARCGDEWVLAEYD